MLMPLLSTMYLVQVGFLKVASGNSKLRKVLFVLPRKDRFLKGLSLILLS